MKLVTVPLHAVAHGRAGDKGNRSNISVIPYRASAFEHLCEQVTDSRVLKLFAHKRATSVARYELPNLPALNFVIDDVLEGGVNDGLGLDGHGKTLSFFLLGGIFVTVPLDCLPDSSPYIERLDQVGETVRAE